MPRSRIAARSTGRLLQGTIFPFIKFPSLDAVQDLDAGPVKIVWAKSERGSEQRVNEASNLTTEHPDHTAFANKTPEEEGMANYY